MVYVFYCGILMSCMIGYYALSNHKCLTFIILYKAYLSYVNYDEFECKGIDFRLFYQIFVFFLYDDL